MNIYKDREIFGNEMLVKYFNKTSNTIVSDIGAGYGNMKKSVEKLGGQWQPFDKYKKMDFSTIWDLDHPAPKGTKVSGTVVFLEVLEHLANPLLGIKHISEILEKGGTLILTTPNPQSSKNIINLVTKGTLYAFQEKHLKEHHVFTPWEHIVRFFLEASGFKIVEYAVVDTQYRDRTPKTIKEFIKKQLEKIIEYRSPKAMGMSYGIVAQKI